MLYIVYVCVYLFMCSLRQKYCIKAFCSIMCTILESMKIFNIILCTNTVQYWYIYIIHILFQRKYNCMPQHLMLSVRKNELIFRAWTETHIKKIHIISRQLPLLAYYLRQCHFRFDSSINFYYDAMKWKLFDNNSFTWK